jgi:hypothetical protein
MLDVSFLGRCMPTSVVSVEPTFKRLQKNQKERRLLAEAGPTANFHDPKEPFDAFR